MGREKTVKLNSIYGQGVIKKIRDLEFENVLLQEDYNLLYESHKNLTNDLIEKIESIVKLEREIQILKKENEHLKEYIRNYDL